MTSRRTRIRALSLTLGLLASLAFTVVAFPGAAQARCIAQNSETTSGLTVNGSTYVTEDPVNGTCNGNNYYQSNFRSNFAGWRASVHIQNNGEWQGHYGGYDTNWYYLEYEDNNNNSLIHLCLDNGTAWWCGWGTSYNSGFALSHADWGVNSGF